MVYTAIKTETLLISIFGSLSFTIIWLFGYTVPRMIWSKGFSFYYKLNPPFDYFNGVWLSGGITFLCLFMVLFDFPSYTDIYKCIKKDFWFKVNEGKQLIKNQKNKSERQ